MTGLLRYRTADSGAGRILRTDRVQTQLTAHKLNSCVYIRRSQPHHRKSLPSRYLRPKADAVKVLPLPMLT
jgi:hypothetical protein